MNRREPRRSPTARSASSQAGPPRGGRSRPSGSGPGLLAGLPIAPIVASVGLVIVAIVSVNLLNNRLTFGTGGPGASGQPGVVPQTPAPSNVVVVPTSDPRTVIPGMIVYAKQGNIWVQSGTSATQLTAGGLDSMPAFSPDGAWVTFVRTREERGLWQVNGSDRFYRMTVPIVFRVRADGSGKPEEILAGRVRSGRYRWFYWIRQPVIGPDGTTVALVSDGPDPTESDVLVQFLDLDTKELTKPQLSQNAPYGHQDPAWRPDGLILAYVKNGQDRATARGTPEIWTWSLLRERSRALTGPGYLHPDFSPDGKYLAATRTSAFGTDIVVLDAATGRELIRVTNTGNAWAPVWSPAGDSIAYLASEGQIVDLRMVEMNGSAPNWTVSEPLNLTEVSGLDSGSRPDWYIPPDELPETPVPATPSPAPSASG